MARDLAIDLGTANTLVYMKGRGIVLNEPSVIALNRQTGEVLATGREAWQMIGRTPGYIVAVRPLRGGAITDFEITERMIRLLLQRVGVSRFTRPKVVICVPSAITEVERRAVTDAARRAGAADANLIEQPMAAAMGCSMSCASAAPARRAASVTARRSTSVMADGTQMTTFGRVKRLTPTRCSSRRIIRSVISKSVMAPPRSGRTATM